MLNSQNTENIKKILVERLGELFKYYDLGPNKDSKNIKIDSKLKGGISKKSRKSI